VTQVVPTVIRYTRGDGTLVVEVEGPEVQVTIDGNAEELIFRGGGLQEVRLRPGSYKIRTCGEGRPVPSVEAFTISRGGKCLVRVTNEAANAPAAAPAQPQGRLPAMVTITPQPLPDFLAGVPLSTLALVSQPAPLPGVRSWTLETRHHRAAVEDVAYSPDGRWIATACRGGSVRVWEAQNRRLERILVPPSTTAKFQRGLCWSPDSRYLATCHNDKDVELWEVATGRLVRTLRSLWAIYTVAWSPDGRSLAGVGWSPRLHIWDVASGNLRRTLEGHTGSIQGLAWSPDGKKLATGSEDKTARVWDAETGQLLRTLEGHSGTVKAVAFAPDDGGLHLATAGFDRTVRIWRADQGFCLHTLRAH
jgi:dipeptidyl aminopeptidase/acylaminoacyl peptidase